MSTPVRRLRKNPAERREEILDAAARIALDEGLERITVRAVADSVGVQPGLISHYFPVVQDLVAAAFERAAAEERDDLFPDSGTPTERVARLTTFIESEAAAPVSRLWLNARHLARFAPELEEILIAQEQIDFDRLTPVVAAGMASGEFVAVDAATAAVRILMAVDAFGTYANEQSGPRRPGSARFVTDAAEWALGLAPGSLTPGAAR